MPIAGLIWAIVWLASGAVQKKTWGTVGLILSIVVGTAWGIGVPLALRAGEDRKEEMACLTNMKRLALAALMYVQDYDEQLPDARNWQWQVSPYLRDEGVLKCPTGGSYAMNPRLSWVRLGDIQNPAYTVLFYEVDAQGKRLENVHRGAANYAFTDGHCKSSTGWPSAPGG